MTFNTITLPGVTNARDLGGYPAGDKKIKKGVLIRSGELCRAEAEAITTLREKYRIQKVLAMRPAKMRRTYLPAVGVCVVLIIYVLIVFVTNQLNNLL